MSSPALHGWRSDNVRVAALSLRADALRSSTSRAYAQAPERYLNATHPLATLGGRVIAAPRSEFTVPEPRSVQALRVSGGVSELARRETSAWGAGGSTPPARTSGSRLLPRAGPAGSGSDSLSQQVGAKAERQQLGGLVFLGCGEWDGPDRVSGDEVGACDEDETAARPRRARPCAALRRSQM